MALVYLGRCDRTEAQEVERLSWESYYHSQPRNIGITINRSTDYNEQSYDTTKRKTTIHHDNVQRLHHEIRSKPQGLSSVVTFSTISNCEPQQVVVTQAGIAYWRESNMGVSPQQGLSEHYSILAREQHELCSFTPLHSQSLIM